MGPLANVKIIELAGIGPLPMCAMLLADLGATVLRIERATPSELGIPRPAEFNPTLRGRSAIAVDLKSTQGRDLVLRLVEQADALVEGFRPGVVERLGIGPTECRERNPRLVYGRMTGWGQDGPLASAAGHDLNYIALAGALGMIGRRGQPPTPPLNLVGDYGGGALYLAVGVLAALLEARTSGEGQVVDAAMVDGAASLMAPFFGLHAAGLHNEERGNNLLDSGAYFYDVYECADGKWISVACIEQRFHDEFLRRIGLDPETFPRQSERQRWEEARQRLAAEFRKRPRDAWCDLLVGTDACVAPVLSLDEAPQHLHNLSRGTFIDIGGVVQPAPAPRFSRTPPGVPTPPATKHSDVAEVLADWGVTET